MRILSALVNNALTRTAALALFVLVVPLTLSIALAALGVPLKGFGWLEEEKQAPAPRVRPATAVVDYTTSPARLAFDQTFRGLDREWSGTSAPIDAAGLPQPFDCVRPAPALSETRTYEAADREVAVTLAAYPAGVGAAMFSRFVRETALCKPITTYLTVNETDGVGVETLTASATWANNGVEMTAFRRGDLVAFVATEPGRGSRAAAETVDGILEPALSRNFCADQSSNLRDVRRNAFFSGRAFTGLTRKEEVRGTRVRDPRLLPEQRALGVEKVTVPAPEVRTVPVRLPSDDYTYPLWPPLPTPVEQPTLPSVPEPQKLRDDALVRDPDPVGPGCGWAFLATIQPTYDEDQVIADNEAAIAAAQAVLDADGVRWKRAVRAYWTAYHTYLTVSIPTYRAYRAEVQEVAAAWDLIHQAWDQYYTAYANWEIAEAERLAFIEEKQAARDTYKAQIAACEEFPDRYAQWQQDMKQYREERRQYREDKARYDEAYAQWEEDYAEWEADEDPKKGPAPEEPEAPVEPVQPEEPVLDHPCPPERPLILDEPTPEAEPAPLPPPDPRPASERD